MSSDTKSSILGVAASGAVSGKRLRRDIEDRGHLFSHAEVKPLQFWKRLIEHHGITHIVDMAAGSAALAIAASGAVEYEGIAANHIHRDWLDLTLDRVVLHLAGNDEDFAKKLGGDAHFLEKEKKYFAGTVMEARRLLHPPDEAQDLGGSSSSGEEAK